MSQSIRDQKSYSAIEKLWSPDEQERKTAKKQVLRIGAKSIGPLISLLLDLLENPYPRFPTGYEAEGENAVEYHKKLSQHQPSYEEIEESIALSTKLFINSRLIDDVVYLLGELRAEEAIGILIRILEGRNMYVVPDTYGCESESLQKIGYPAVPCLIAAIRGARSTAEKHSDIHLGCVMDFGEIDSPQNNETVRLPIAWFEEGDEQETEEEVNFRVRRIQCRSLRILGAIRDPTALPFLTQLLAEAVDERLIIDVQAVIDIITERNSSRSRVGDSEGMAPRSALQD